MPPKKFFIYTLKKLDYGSAIAVRLTKLTGKAKVPTHPKHLISPVPWFTKYLSSKDVVLDLGSNIGENSIKAAKRCNRVLGLEIDEQLIRFATESSRQRKINNVKFIKANLEEPLKLKRNSFDKILFLATLEHLEKRDQILSEIKKVIKQKGKIFLSVPNSQSSWKKLQRSAGICSYSDSNHKIEFSEDSIVKLLLKHKFKIISIDYEPYDTPLRGLTDIIGGISLGLYKKIMDWRIRKTAIDPRECSGFRIILEK